MKTKDEVIDGFMQRHCALLMDANMPAYNAIRSQLDGIWQNGYMAGINCSEQSVEIAKHKWYEEGYNKGYEEGQNRISHKPVLEELFEVAADKKKEIEDEAYKRGLKESWEAAWKIAGNEKGSLTLSELYELFATEDFNTIFLNFSAQEAIDKIKAWEEKQPKPITNAEKFKEVFGNTIRCDKNLDKDERGFVINPIEGETWCCKTAQWLDMPYVEPKTEEKLKEMEKE